MSGKHKKDEVPSAQTTMTQQVCVLHHHKLSAATT